jgi:hypothetical protein
MTGDPVDLRALTDATAAATSGVAHAEALVELAEAMVGEDDAALAKARGRVLEELGPEALVDAVAVASNFERMVRIADSTGIPVDGPVEVMSQDLRAELELERFGSSANTPASGGARRALGSLLRPIARVALRLLGRRRARGR